MAKKKEAKKQAEEPKKPKGGNPTKVHVFPQMGFEDALDTVVGKKN